MIKVEIVAHSLSPQGDELISVLCTFPRIILAEVNTHRMLSKNTSSSRAIPFNKMVEAIQDNPFIPIAWQKDHKGMQGNEYLDEHNSKIATEHWLKARDFAIAEAEYLNGNFTKEESVTKQLCNRLLEPFMWTTMLITGSRQGWNNFFYLRCPDYVFHNEDEYHFKSRKEVINFGKSINDTKIEYPGGVEVEMEDLTDLDWLKLNLGHAEIHMMTLAESIYDAVNESTPEQLNPGQWHVPFIDKIVHNNITLSNEKLVKISTAMAARTSYTVVGEEKEIDYSKMIELHDRLISQNPPHSSPMEHCARAMSDFEYERFIKGHSDHDVIAWTTPIPTFEGDALGWCYNLKGFIPYRYLIDNKENM